MKYNHPGVTNTHPGVKVMCCQIIVVVNFITILFPKIFNPQNKIMVRSQSSRKSTNTLKGSRSVVKEGGPNTPLKEKEPMQETMDGKGTELCRDGGGEKVEGGTESGAARQQADCQVRQQATEELFLV